MAQQLRLAIDGMHCAACVRRVRNALEALASAQPGVRVVEVEIGSALLESNLAAEELGLGSALDRIGFQLTRIETS
jgi:copper chaperone